MSFRVARMMMSALAMLAACGSSSPTVDAGPCWPLTTTPGGTVEAGTGDGAFETMPSSLTFQLAAQAADPYLVINARMTGLAPGNAEDELDSSNPKTMVTVVIDAASLTLAPACPAGEPYIADADSSGSYELYHPLKIGIGDSSKLSAVNGQIAHITVEIVDHTGKAATDEKDVTVYAPSSTGADAGVDAGP